MVHAKFAKSSILILLSFVFRLAAGMLVIVLLARALGPAEFGTFTLYLSVATLLSVPISLGLPTFILREMGANPARYPALMASALTAKLIVAAVVVLVAVVGAAQLPPSQHAVCLLLLLAQVADSFGEFYNLGFRRMSAYVPEATTAIATSSLHLVLMVGLVLLWPHAVAAALVFAVSRCVGALIVVLRVSRLAGPVRPAPVRSVKPLLREIWPYTGELGVFTAYGQMDSLIVNHFLGVAGVGLYQAGMKLVDGACRLAPVLAQLILPGLTYRANDPQQERAAVLKVLGGLGAMGLAGMAVLVLGADLVVSHLFGSRFAELRPLLPGFGLLILFKYLETAGGLVLVARGLQHLKVWLVVAQLALALGLGLVLMGRYGMAGWQAAVIGTTGLLLAGYVLLYRHGRRPRAAAASAA